MEQVKFTQCTRNKMKIIFIHRPPHLFGTDPVYNKIMRDQYYSVFNIGRSLPLVVCMSTKFTLPINLLNTPK